MGAPDPKEFLAAHRAAERADEAAERDAPDLVRDAEHVERLEGANRYVVTAAMNNTPIHRGFWTSLRRYADDVEAELVVIPIRYRNPTSRIEADRDEAHIWWPEEVLPYLAENRVRLHKRLYLMGDVPIQATAVRPLSGLDAMGRGASIIVGHARLALRMVPTPHYVLPKMLATSCTVSMPVYSRSKAGAKAEFHHEIGAQIVEAGREYHVRQLLADRSGGFFDLDRYFHPRGVDGGQRVEALICGDEHTWWADPDVVRATYEGPESICGVTRPRRIVHHDLVDSYSITHHHRRKPFTRIAKHRTGRHSLRAELQHAVEYLEQHMPRDAENLIVGANHLDHIWRWIEEADWREDPENAETYLELALEMVRGVKMTETGADAPDPFQLWFERRMSNELRGRTTFVGRESHLVKGIEVGMHGDVGPNGARGSIRNLSRIGARSVIGHSHSPGIDEGCFQVGTSTGQLEYSRGAPSSWANTHCLIYANSKRTLVSIVEGEWRLR